MMEKTFYDFVQELKEKNDLVDVIGSYIKLERRGYNYWACCPFHHEKTPSFSVNAADRYYHCFGCGVSGDVLGFVKAYENVDFMQAVHILAARVGLEVPAYDDKAAAAAAEKKKKRDRLLLLMRDAARFYLGNLYSGRGGDYLAYLQKRGVSPSTAKKFGLGASFDFDSLPSYLFAQGYTKEECLESGACMQHENGRLYDAEGGRLIVPIINHFDEVIAFGGRALQKTDRAKYKNTRETVLFNKSKTLYNLNLVKKEKQAAGLPYLIMVEGYMDAISLYEAGFKNVVASMGTSLTKEQARLCKRYSESVYISYDGDFAGQKANLRGLDILKQEGMKVRVVPLPEGLDPDDVIRQTGAQGYRDCIEKAMPLIDFRLLSVERKYDLDKTDEKRDFVREALSIVREAESATEREELLKRLARSTGISLAALQRDLEYAPVSTDTAPEPPSKKQTNADAEKKAARFILAACLFSKPYAQNCDLSAFEFTDEVHRAIAAYIVAGRETGGVRPSGVFDLVDSESVELSEILGLDYGDNLSGEVAATYFQDCALALTEKTLRARLEEERARAEHAETREERREILLRIDEYNKRLKNLRSGGKI